jgi:hypothetical protein
MSARGEAIKQPRDRVTHGAMTVARGPARELESQSGRGQLLRWSDYRSVTQRALPTDAAFGRPGALRRTGGHVRVLRGGCDGRC